MHRFYFFAEPLAEKLLEHLRTVEVGGFVEAVAADDVHAQLGQNFYVTNVDLMLQFEIPIDQIRLFDSHHAKGLGATNLLHTGQAHADRTEGGQLQRLGDGPGLFISEAYLFEVFFGAGGLQNMAQTFEVLRAGDPAVYTVSDIKITEKRNIKSVRPVMIVPDRTV